MMVLLECQLLFLFLVVLTYSIHKICKHDYLNIYKHVEDVPDEISEEIYDETVVQYSDIGLPLFMIFVCILMQ